MIYYQWTEVYATDRIYRKEKYFCLCLIAAVSGGRKKRATVTDFYLCDNDTGKFVGECGQSGNKLKIKCKFVVAQTCVYKVGCAFSNTGWQCPVPDHVFHYLHCCDYVC